MPLISYFSLTPGSSSVSFLFLSTVVIPFFSILGFLTVAFIPYTMYFSPNLVLISWFLSPGSSPLTLFLSPGYSLVPLPSPCSFLLVSIPWFSLPWPGSYLMVFLPWFLSPDSHLLVPLPALPWFLSPGSHVLVLISYPFLTAPGSYSLAWFFSPGSHLLVPIPYHFYQLLVSIPYLGSHLLVFLSHTVFLSRFLLFYFLVLHAPNSTPFSSSYFVFLLPSSYNRHFDSCVLSLGFYLPGFITHTPQESRQLWK